MKSDRGGEDPRKGVLLLPTGKRILKPGGTDDEKIFCV